MAPDSRRSESCGLFSPVDRCSGARESCDSAMIGRLQLLRHLLERAADVGDLLLAALVAAAAAHELEVVHDEEVQAPLELQPARLRRSSR
jgi:hypothetical protein